MANTTPVHDVLFFGGSGAGKTTLLGLMTDQATRDFLDRNLDLRVRADREHIRPLIEAVENTKRAFAEQPFETPFEVVGATARGFWEYLVNVEQEQSRIPYLRVRFVDTAGELFQGLEEDLWKRMETSRAALLVIDSVELFFGDFIPAELRRNSPGKTHELIDHWIAKGPKTSLLLCVVPVKCEHWLRARPGHDHLEGANTLLEKIASEYDLAFQRLKRHSDRVAVVVAPVQTVGNLVFKEHQPRDGKYPIQQFQQIVGTSIKTDDNGQSETGFAPVNADQPLRHLLSWLLIEELERRRGEELKELEDILTGIKEIPFFGDWLAPKARYFINVLLDVFGENRELAKAIAMYVRDRKTSLPFKIIQGQHRLTRSDAIWDLFV